MSDTITRTLYLDVLSISAAIRHAKVLREKQLTGNVRLCCPVGSIRRRRKERSVEMEPQVQQVFEGLGRVDTYITGENIVTSFYCTTDRSGTFPNYLREVRRFGVPWVIFRYAQIEYRKLIIIQMARERCLQTSSVQDLIAFSIL